MPPRYPNVRTNHAEDVSWRLANGRGCGTGSSYLPWLTVYEVSSRGVASRIPSRRLGRVVHVLSEVERAAFLLAEWGADTVDVREQVPLLPLEATLRLADTLGIVHPRFAGRAVVMTSDLVVTRRGPAGPFYETWSCKRTSGLTARGVEKFLLERAYWAERGVAGRLVTERELPWPRVRNIAWARPGLEPAQRPLPGAMLEEAADGLWTAALADVGASLARACLRVDRSSRTAPGTHLSVARWAIATRRWCVNMDLPVLPSHPLATLTAVPSAAPAGRRTAVTAIADPQRTS